MYVYDTVQECSTPPAEECATLTHTHTHTFIYICMYIYVKLYIYLYKYLEIFIYIHIYTHTHAHTHTGTAQECSTLTAGELPTLRLFVSNMTCFSSRRALMLYARHDML
jgi:hypothetical protein